MKSSLSVLLCFYAISYLKICNLSCNCTCTLQPDSGCSSQVTLCVTACTNSRVQFVSKQKKNTVLTNSSIFLELNHLRQNAAQDSTE